LEAAVTDSDLTLSILREIRDATRSNTEELRAVKDELRGTNERLDVTNQRLTVVEHTVNDAAGQIVLLGRYITNRHEAAIDDLRERVTRLEAKASG